MWDGDVGPMVPIVGIYDIEGEEGFVLLYAGILVLSSDQPLDVEDRPGWILGGLVLGGVSYESCTGFVGEECDVGWRDAVALFVGTDFDSVVTPEGYAGIGRSEVYSYARARGSFGG